MKDGSSSGIIVVLSPDASFKDVADAELVDAVVCATSVFRGELELTTPL